MTGIIALVQYKLKLGYLRWSHPHLYLSLGGYKLVLQQVVQRPKA